CRSWSGCGRWDGWFPPSSAVSTCSCTRRRSSRRCSPPETRLRRWSPKRGGSSMAPKRKAEATRWFQQAAYDLKAARWNVQGGFHDTACFLSQQAGEKAMESLLYYVGGRRVALLTHSLVEMITHAGKQVGSLTELPSTTSPRGTRMACPAATRTPSTDRRPRRKPSRRPNGSSTPSHTTTGAPASTASSNRPKGGNPSVLHARSQRAAADSFSHAS